MVPPAPHRLFVLAVVAVAVLGVGLAAPLIRLADAPALAVAFWRMAFSTAITGAFWAATPRDRDEPEGPGRRRWSLAALSGLFLGIHFAAWIQSLSLTSVAASVVLVNTQPIFVALLATVFLREPATRLQWSGILIAVLGAAVISLDVRPAGVHHDRPLLGNLLALTGAVAGACYYVIGRSLRKTMGLWAYVTRVYAVSAAFLLALALATGTALAPYSPATWGIFVALAVGPSLLGHTLLNWSLRWLPAAAVNVAALGEPIVAALLVASIPAIREIPGRLTAAGGAITLAGIGLVLWRPSRPARRDPIA